MSLFSIVHATARYDKWEESYLAWHLDNKFDVEYILAVDDPKYIPKHAVKLVYTDLTKGLPGCVRAYNDGAKASTGKIILLNSDDMFPPDDWQIKILQKVQNRLDEEWVLGVDAGNPEVFTFQIMSRARYEKQGYALYPGFHSLYGDTDFTYRAYHDLVVVPAPDIKVTHRHPCFGYPWDDVYRHENNPQWLEHGRKLFEERKNNKWN